MYLVVDVFGCAASSSVDFQCCSKLRVRPASSSVTSSHDEPPDDLTTSGLSCSGSFSARTTVADDLLRTTSED